MVSFFLDQSNIAQLPKGTPYLELTIFDGADAIGKTVGKYTAVNGDVVFEVTALQALSQYAGSKFGLDEFAFNTTDPLAMFRTANFQLPNNWTVSMGPRNADGYGKFELLPMTNGANNMQTPLWFVITNITGDSASTYQEISTGNAGQGNTDFAAHVINFSVQGASSAWFGGQTPTPVPLPGDVWLLLSGLCGLVVSGRRSLPRLTKLRPPSSRAFADQAPQNELTALLQPCA